MVWLAAINDELLSAVALGPVLTSVDDSRTKGDSGTCEKERIKTFVLQRRLWAKLFYFTLNVVGAGIGLLGVLAGNGDLKGVGISRSAPRTTVLAGVSGT